MDEKLLELLYRSFDSELSHDEQNILNQALKKSEELRSHKNEMIKMRDYLKHDKPHGFGYMFADKVMEKIKDLEEIAPDELFFDSIVSVFKPLAIAATFILVFLVSYNVIIEDESLFNDIPDSQYITLAEAFDPFNELTLE